MSAYVVFTRTKTIDQSELEIYWKTVKETMANHPIEVLSPYGNFEVLEGNQIEGMVIAKFPDMEAARKWYYSESYQKVAEHRKKGAIYQGILIEGII